LGGRKPPFLSCRKKGEKTCGEKGKVRDAFGGKKTLWKEQKTEMPEVDILRCEDVTQKIGICEESRDNQDRVQGHKKPEGDAIKEIGGETNLHLYNMRKKAQYKVEFARDAWVTMVGIDS